MKEITDRVSIDDVGMPYEKDGKIYNLFPAFYYCFPSPIQFVEFVARRFEDKQIDWDGFFDELHDNRNRLRFPISGTVNIKKDYVVRYAKDLFNREIDFHKKSCSEKQDKRIAKLDYIS